MLFLINDSPVSSARTNKYIEEESPCLVSFSIPKLYAAVPQLTRQDSSFLSVILIHLVKFLSKPRSHNVEIRKP